MIRKGDSSRSFDRMYAFLTNLIRQLMNHEILRSYSFLSSCQLKKARIKSIKELNNLTSSLMRSCCDKNQVVSIPFDIANKQLSLLPETLGGSSWKENLLILKYILNVAKTSRFQFASIESLIGKIHGKNERRENQVTKLPRYQRTIKHIGQTMIHRRRTL